MPTNACARRKIFAFDYSDKTPLLFTGYAKGYGYNYDIDNGLVSAELKPWAALLHSGYTGSHAVPHTTRIDFVSANFTAHKSEVLRLARRFRMKKQQVNRYLATAKDL